MRKSITERFEEKYIPEPNSGCWLWIAAQHSFGYGKLFFNGRVVEAHRVSWELYRGPISDGNFVCHHCDIPSCVNPDHLFLGSQADNLADMRVKGRHNIGERNGGAKLTPSDVLAIRKDRRLQRFIAQDFGIRQQQVSRIKRGDRWRCLHG